MINSNNIISLGFKPKKINVNLKSMSMVMHQLGTQDGSNSCQFESKYNNSSCDFKLEAKDFNHETAVFHAVRAGSVNSLKLLLQRNANTYHLNKQNKTAAAIAHEMQAWGCLLLLVQNGSPFPEGLNIDDVPESEDKLVKFIEHNNDVSKLISHGETIRVAELVERGIVTNCFRNIKNQSAVMIAYKNRNFENFVFLKANGLKESCQEPPLDVSLLSHLEQMLLKHVMASYVKYSYFSRRG